MRRHATRRIALFTALCLILVTAGVLAESPELRPLADGKGSFHFLTSHPADAPLTIQARFTFEKASDLEAFWVGLGDSSEAAPTMLSLVWAEDRSAWFPVWSLHLQTDSDLFSPGVATKNGAGVLAGSKVVSLQNVRPEVGHVYQAELSYDPENDLVSVGLSDLTAGERLFTRELAISAPETPLYPAIGAVGGELTIESVEAMPISVPLGAAWELLVRDGDRYSRLALYRLTPSVEMAFRLGAHGEYAGRFAVQVESEQGATTLVELPAAAQSEERLVPFSAGDLPLGPLTVEIAYIDESGRVWTLGSRSLLNVAATLEVRFDDLQVDGDAVTGLLTVVSTDEQVENLPVKLLAQVAEVGSEGTYQPVLSTKLEQVTGTPIRVPFSVPLPSEGSLFSLGFEVEFGVPVGVVGSQSQFHVLRVAAD